MKKYVSAKESVDVKDGRPARPLDTYPERPTELGRLDEVTALGEALGA